MMDDAVTIAQAADLMGMHKNTVRQWIKLGKLPASKVKTDRGETYLIPRSALDVPHLNGQEQPTVTDSPAPIPTVNPSRPSTCRPTSSLSSSASSIQPSPSCNPLTIKSASWRSAYATWRHG